MTNAACHKTLFVLDRSPYFTKSSKQSIDYDILSKSKTPGIIPAAPINKSLWTCNVEATLEYMRIVYDLFPGQNLIQVITGSQVLNTWAVKDQSLQHLMLALAHIGPPGSDGDGEDEYSVTHGLLRACEVMCEPSEKQQEVWSSDDSSQLQNHARVICLTTVKSEAHIRMLEECVHDALIQHNKLAATMDTLLPVDHCELVLVNIYPVGDDVKLSDRLSREVSSLLSSEVFVSQSGRFLYYKLMQLVQQHFSLSSTTVTGIPMKEEQNASSSANYDVELLHSADAHDELFKSAHNEGLAIPSKEGLPTETYTLKWCTPKSNVIELHHCPGAFRITPVDVNSRPSSCLTNFLLSGRSVMLEQPRKSGTKVISHMLTSHGGEIFIHTIATSRLILEDPPSISEGSGGRVIDYRITDFGELMKENRLAPATPEVLEKCYDPPIEKAKQHLERVTRYWPIVISDSIIFNILSHLDPLPTLIIKEYLDDNSVIECKKAIYHVVGMESRNEPLPVSSSGSRGKGPKRDEQYRQMWSELETLVRAYVDMSPNHEKVLECILECRKPLEESKTNPSPRRASEKMFIKEEKMDLSEGEQALKEFERYQTLSEREKLELNKADIKMESPPKKFKPGADDLLAKSGGGQNLLSLWTNRINALHSKKHVEFAGRVESDGNIAVLYKQVKDEATGDSQEKNSNR